jgi:DNA-binding NarL/FixJ family response regulator
MNLLLVDDHALFREGLRALLEKISPGVEIHETAAIKGAVELCAATEFRMALLDLGLAASDGLATLDEFRLAIPELPVVVLSSEQDPACIRAAIEKGAVGFIPKSHTADLMIAALQFVTSGGVYLPPHVLGLKAQLNEGDAAPADRAALFGRFSTRQREVAQMLLQGRSNKEIARQLNVSEGTVKAHVSAIFQLLGAKNRVEAVMIAAKSGIKVM